MNPIVAIVAFAVLLLALGIVYDVLKPEPKTCSRFNNDHLNVFAGRRRPSGLRPGGKGK
jgi:hypothetical protein